MRSKIILRAWSLLLLAIMIFLMTPAVLAEPSAMPVSPDELLSDKATSKPSVLRRGNSGAMVAAMQNKLVEYGYPSAQNRKFDAKTVTAVRYFQAANGIKVSGVATSATLNVLYNGTQVVPYEVFEASELLMGSRPGTKGLRVVQIQTRLKALGYYKGKINGAFTSSLKKAVVRFKQFNNISPASGVISKANRVVINADTALSYAQVAGPDTVKPGQKGQKVMRLQLVMKDLKYYKGAVDGRYGAALKSAVKRFQKAKKLYPTGIAYSTTLELLREKMAVAEDVNPQAHALVTVAKEQLAKRYKSRAAGPKAFDCSGLTRYVFKRAVGINLAASAMAQSRRGTLIVNKSDVLPGDLLFFATGKSKTKLNHVGVCTNAASGEDIRFIHASSSKRKVIVSSFKDGGNGNFYAERFLFARRMW